MVNKDEARRETMRGTMRCVFSLVDVMKNLEVNRMRDRREENDDNCLFALV